LTFRLEHPLHFFLGPDESFSGEIPATLDEMLAATKDEWRKWVRGLAIPLEWQNVVIRSAITLKLCQHEETGAIVAALTTSIPEHAGSQRNWDYRYCWIRDAYYTVQALNRLGALDVLESYLTYLRNIVDAAKGGDVQPLYSVLGEARLEKALLTSWAAIAAWGRCARAMPPISSASTTPMARSSCPARKPFSINACCANPAWPISKRWKKSANVRGIVRQARRRSLGIAHPPIGPYGARQCAGPRATVWAMPPPLGLEASATHWNERAAHIRNRIEESAWRPEHSACPPFSGDDLDASVIQLLDLRFLAPDDPLCFRPWPRLKQGFGCDRMLRMRRRMISGCLKRRSTSAPSG
jgi:hypothetical protein